MADDQALVVTVVAENQGSDMRLTGVGMDGSQLGSTLIEDKAMSQRDGFEKLREACGFSIFKDIHFVSQDGSLLKETPDAEYEDEDAQLEKKIDNAEDLRGIVSDQGLIEFLKEKGLHIDDQWRLGEDFRSMTWYNSAGSEFAGPFEIRNEEGRQPFTDGFEWTEELQKKWFPMTARIVCKRRKPAKTIAELFNL
eukprot:gnl/TRDRNA2_/TRDRNA2_175058_c5_seq3.p1 gnl/TRDRNA2_/TRDRNA2_175058_c5~~gnl/TRDRNA2_/TRDRNA2_175058_c5_seq3.p1  ORF type:complete len:227 (+),score=43.51 gnl/TRDRNA2_/TRDRNA2_175058_c5_seq3:99-683(+)